MTYFNSTMVRLEEPVNINEYVQQQFQFHHGTIGSYLGTMMEQEYL